MKRIKIAWSTEREVLVALVLLLLFVVALGAVAYSLVVGFSKTLQTLDRSREITIIAEDLYRHLLSAETTQRGYVITGSLDYLEPYEQNVQNVQASRAALTRSIAQASQYANEVQILSAQIDSKLAELANTVAIRRTYGFAAANSVVSTDLGLSLMDNIREGLHALITAEREQFSAARALVVQRISTIAGLAFLLVFCVLVLATVVYLLVRRGMRARATVERGLSKALHRERELNELKTHFIRTVSHEFRTPLAIIQTSADLLKNYGHRMSETRREEHMDKLQAQIVRLTALLEDAVTVQRIQFSDLDYEPAMVDVRELCQQAIASVAELGGERRIDFNAVGSDFTAHVDADLLKRALRNLLVNALQYSSENSTVCVELSFRAAAATIRVVDHGVGIAENDQPRLFDLFYRGANAADVPGTGLGLPVAKSIVELHQGRISFESKVGAGAVFTVELPVSRATPATAA